MRGPYLSLIAPSRRLFLGILFRFESALVQPLACGYSAYIMKTMELSLARIGNSRGIRLPSALIRKHGLEDGMVLEDRGHEIVLTPKSGSTKLSWEETAREMASSGEDWSEWETTVADGLEQIPWEATQGVPTSKLKKKAKITNEPVSVK